MTQKDKEMTTLNQVLTQRLGKVFFIIFISSNYNIVCFIYRRIRGIKIHEFVRLYY